MINKIKIFLALLLVSCIDISAEKYSDIIDNMPNMTFDQAYYELMEYQKNNPNSANVYLQLAIVSEHKMILVDPIKDFSEAQFWAEKATDFFANFQKLHDPSDVKKHEELYLNLYIPHPDLHITDADLMTFVASHNTMCKNFKDSTALAFKALDEAKIHYNKCIDAFKNLCQKYPTRNDMLLQYNDDIKKIFKQISSDFAWTIGAFDEYKKITKTHHILNYRQLYELKTITNYRLDGLTNSNFLDNHFTIWNFRQWIDDFEKNYDNDIVPLKENIEKINLQFTNEDDSISVENVFSQLGKYDNNSLVRALFKYLDARHQLIILAKKNTENDSIITLLNNLSKQLVLSKEKLTILQNSITPEKVELFHDFFAKNYDNINGLKNFAKTQEDELRSIFQNVIDKAENYYESIEKNDENLTKWLQTNELSGTVNLCKLDDTGQKIWEKPTGMNAINIMKETNNGIIVIGSDAQNEKVIKFINDNGNIMYVFTRNSKENVNFTTFSDQGKIIFTTLH